MPIVTNVLYTRVVTQSSSILFLYHCKQYIAIYGFFATRVKHIFGTPLSSREHRSHSNSLLDESPECCVGSTYIIVSERDRLALPIQCVHLFDDYRIVGKHELIVGDNIRGTYLAVRSYG